jgi:hypothetical protein
MTTPIELPEGFENWKGFRRIMEMLTEYVSDEVGNLAEYLLKENGIPDSPDPNDNEAYDKWYSEVLQPVEDMIWNSIGNSLSAD